MPDIDPAHILFASDVPASARQAPAQSAPPARIDPAGQSPASSGEGTSEGAAKALYGAEAGQTAASDGADYSGAFEKLDDLAHSLKVSGESERSAQWVEATEVMFEDALVHATPPGTVMEISGYLHEAAGAMAEMSPEALADGQAKALMELGEAGVTDADLDVARSMITSMEGRIPNLAWQLEKSGLGNSVPFIKALIKEGKRRSVR